MALVPAETRADRGTGIEQHRRTVIECDAALFTSQIQFRHLLSVAESRNQTTDLLRKLRDDVVVGSVGPVCSRALRAAGIVPDVMPHLPNGPSLVQALADYYSMFTPPEEITG